MTIAKITEITAESPESFEHAIRTGIARASMTLEGVQGAWVKDQKLVVEDGRIKLYRVNMKVTFVLKEK